MAFLSEAAVEGALLEQLKGLGYCVEREEDIGPDGDRAERNGHDEVVLRNRFKDAVARLNLGLPVAAHQDAIRKVMQSELPSLLEENRRLHKLMTEGVDVEYYAHDGTLTAGKVTLIDFEHPEKNDWLAVSQFVVEEQHRVWRHSARTRTGDPADRQPCGGLNRDRGHSGCRRHQEPGHFHPLR